MNYNYRDWVAIKKIDKPMSNMRTVNYLIKCYNIKKINDINKGRLDKADKYDLICQGLKNIKKDLEILEILKKRLNIKIPYGSVNVISVNNDDDYLLFEVELQEHTKIEEWLENDK